MVGVVDWMFWGVWWFIIAGTVFMIFLVLIGAFRTFLNPTRKVPYVPPDELVASPKSNRDRDGEHSGNIDPVSKNRKMCIKEYRNLKDRIPNEIDRIAKTDGSPFIRDRKRAGSVIDKTVGKTNRSPVGNLQNPLNRKLLDALALQGTDNDTNAKHMDRRRNSGTHNPHDSSGDNSESSGEQNQLKNKQRTSKHSQDSDDETKIHYAEWMMSFSEKNVDTQIFCDIKNKIFDSDKSYDELRKSIDVQFDVLEPFEIDVLISLLNDMRKSQNSNENTKSIKPSLNHLNMNHRNSFESERFGNFRSTDYALSPPTSLRRRLNKGKYVNDDNFNNGFYSERNRMLPGSFEYGEYGGQLVPGSPQSDHSASLRNPFGQISRSYNPYQQQQHEYGRYTNNNHHRKIMSRRVQPRRLLKENDLSYESEGSSSCFTDTKSNMSGGLISLDGNVSRFRDN